MRAVLSVVVAGLVTLQPSAQPDLVRGLQWHIGVMRLEEVHGRATGAGMVIAVVDSGVDSQHADLTGQVLQGPDPKANADTDGRGTGLAGLIAGHGHSDTALSAADPGEAGVLGVAPSAKILPIAFAPVAGQVGDPNELATGIELAVNRGARIICIARGTAPSERLEFAINVAVEKDVLVVAADSSTWPASYPGVLTSIPADRAGAVRQPPASGRTTGIVAPGADLITTDRAGGYRLADTFAAAAILTGAAAVVWSANPNAKASEIIEVLRRTANDRGTPGADRDFGVGDLNLLAALNAASVKPSGSASPQPAATASKRPAGTAATGTPLIESGDWRRWLVVLPLLLFLGGVGLWAYRAGRARKISPASVVESGGDRSTLG